MSDKNEIMRLEWVGKADEDLISLQALLKHKEGSPYYIETRYPADRPDFTWEQSEKAFEVVKKMKEFARP